VVVLTVALLIASVGLLATFASAEPVTTRPGSPETSPANPPVGEVGDPTTTLAATTTTTVPAYPVVTWTVAPVLNTRSDTTLGYAEPTTNGITIHNAGGVIFQMEGPSTRLAFGFDGPVIVHQAGAPYGEVPPTQPLIRITTAEESRILPTGDLGALRLLHATVIEDRPIVLYASTDNENIASLHVFDIETEAAADLGVAGAWQTDFIDAFLDPYSEEGDVIVYRSEQNPEAWDLAGNVTVLDEEPCGC
jgi:hypothetical protein